jgi:outer membrane protein OmpA-like peptidoglycan-associated protein
MTTRRVSIGAVAVLCGALLAPASAQVDLGGKLKGAIGGGAIIDPKGKIEKEVNARLLDEGRKNQCSFKTDSDVLMPGCDAKLKKLASALVDAKKKLGAIGINAYKFEVSGHTDSSGKVDHNKALSGKRAQTIVKELVSRGIPAGEIVAVGMGSERPVVTPDNTPAKKAKNRRYEIQVLL